MAVYASEVVRVAEPSADDLRVFTHLRDVELRQSLEAEYGIYLAEGEKVIRRALAAGHTPHSLLLTERWLQQLTDLPDAPCFVMTESEIERLTGFHVHRGALAAMHRPEPRAVEDVLATARRVVIAEDLVDHTNLGAIFRTASALGFDAVLLSPRCADPFYRRSIKVAMGAVFQMPHARFEDWYDAPAVLEKAGFTTVALTLGADALPLQELDAPDRLALIVGSEGNGLSEHWEGAANVRVTIPMAAGVDSLNVAASLAIACWHVYSGGSTIGETGQSEG
jgi:tRNA G18 (ribose-2'-O)-methylase SpoU